MIVLGIDPGLDGALCCMTNNTDGVCAMLDMPTLSLSRNGKGRREIDADALLGWLPYLGHAFVEQAWTRPKNGASAAFKSGEGYGLLRGILKARGTPITIVSPQAWKKDLRLGRGKDAARARASELMPNSAHHWPLKKHDGRAESALICLWGIRSLNGIARGGAASTEEQKYSDENRCSATNAGSLAPSVERQ